MKRLLTIILAVAMLSTGCASMHAKVQRAEKPVGNAVGMIAAGGMIYWISSFSRSFPENNQK